jgi:hypothetical protein
MSRREAIGATNRDTRAVVREMFTAAERSVTVFLLTVLTSARGPAMVLTVLTLEDIMAKAASDRASGSSFVEKATRRFREGLEDLVSAHERAGHAAHAVLGDPAEFATRALRATAPVPSPWDELAGPFTLSDGVQARLGISRQAVAAKAARRRLLRVITTDDIHLYPVWQFDGKQMVEGLADVLALFPEDEVDGWTLAGWLRTADPDLGEPPFEALARGGVERVQAVARSAARALAG